jgi:hypothetical protein
MTIGIGRGVVRGVALAAALAAAAQAADVKVTQGPAREKFLWSPMFLEMPLEAKAAGTKAGPWVNVDDFDAWACDFVHIKRIATRITPRKDRVDLDIKVFTFTEASRDKAVRMEFRLQDGETVIGETSIPHIEAEEKKRGYGMARLSVPRETWPAEETSLLMKIDVHVTND